MTKKKQVISILNSIETGDFSSLSAISPAQYIQHNPEVPDGIAGLKEFIKAGPSSGGFKVQVVRVIEDGNFVAAHTNYRLFGKEVVAFDVFRFEDGLIVEHWDNIVEKQPPNPSGHTQTEGKTEIEDLSRTEANKAIAKSFVETILIRGEYDKIENYFNGDHYIQHHPQIGDGLSGLNTALASMAKQGITMEYSQIHRVLGEGNFVLILSEGKLGGQPTAYYDLFRIEKEKVAEHWDVVSPISSETPAKNKNGKF